jgi:localization factor PodJL
MVQPVPWNVRGIDPDVREAALLAARRSGMTLGQWLNAVIGDTVSADSLQQAAGGETASPADPFAAVTRRIRALNERGSSAALAAAGATRHGDDVARVGEIVGSAIENMERSASERDARTIAALEAMTALLRRQAAETPRPGDAAAAELAEGGSSAGNPVRKMIERIETRLDTLGADTPGANIEASLRELDNRLAAIARKLEQPSRIVVEPVRDDNIERIEDKIGAILDTLNLKTLRAIAREATAEEAAEPASDAPAEALATEAPAETLPAEPAAEAPAIAEEASLVPERPPIPAEHIRSVVDDIARRQHDLDAEDEAFADLTAPVEASAPLGDL